MTRIIFTDIQDGISSNKQISSIVKFKNEKEIVYFGNLNHKV